MSRPFLTFCVVASGFLTVAHMIIDSRGAAVAALLICSVFAAIRESIDD